MKHSFLEKFLEEFLEVLVTMGAVSTPKLCPSGIKQLCYFAKCSFATKYCIRTIRNDYACTQSLIAFMHLENDCLEIEKDEVE